ncbi:uncharacterized protein LOC142324580 [Lycorma delicatula]|uniref:uncharacterized protein LOC142324580 n=1 Tax=Lycorma delicatula TaxID=130591 RepID=UPI003F50FF46
MVTFSNQNWPECRVRKNCIIISWKDNESKSPPNLQYGRTIAKRGLNACKCTRKYQIDTLICVRRHSICYGSGGSPLLCEGELVGLAHANFDKHCNNSIMTHTRIQTECNESDKYSVYTYLFAYKVWISQYIEVFDRSDQIRQYTDIYSDKFRTKHERAVNKYERSDRVIVMDHFSDQLIIYLCLMACCNISLKSTNYAACNLLLLLSIAN